MFRLRDWLINFSFNPLLYNLSVFYSTCHVLSICCRLILVWDTISKKVQALLLGAHGLIGEAYVYVDEWGSRLIGVYGTMQRRTSVEAESGENFILKLIINYHSEIIWILTQPESHLFLQTTWLWQEYEFLSVFSQFLFSFTPLLLWCCCPQLSMNHGIILYLALFVSKIFSHVKCTFWKFYLKSSKLEW